MKALVTELRRIADALERLAGRDHFERADVQREYVSEMRDRYAASEAQRARVTGVR